MTSFRQSRPIGGTTDEALAHKQRKGNRDHGLTLSGMG